MTYVLDARNLDLDTLALTHLVDNGANLAGGVERRATRKHLPVIEDRLGEGLSRSGLTQVAVEAERLQDGQVSLDVEQRSTGALLLVEDVTTTAGQDTVDTTHGLLRHLNLDEIHGLKQSGLSEQGRGVQDTTSSRDDLATTTVDGIGVEGHIHEVEADRSHGLLSDGTLTGSPLETRDNGILDFVQVLNGLGLVD